MFPIFDPTSCDKTHISKAFKLFHLFSLKSLLQNSLMLPIFFLFLRHNINMTGFYKCFLYPGTVCGVYDLGYCSFTRIILYYDLAHLGKCPHWGWFCSSTYTSDFFLGLCFEISVSHLLPIFIFMENSSEMSLLLMRIFTFASSPIIPQRLYRLKHFFAPISSSLAGS